MHRHTESVTRLFQRPGEEPIRVAECECGASWVTALPVALPDETR